MKFYAACLASYNNGVLHGKWIDASSDEDEMQTQIATMLRESPYPNVSVVCEACDGSGTADGLETCAACKGTGEVPSAEEYAVHDYDEGLPSSFGEYPRLADIAAYVELSEEHSDIKPEDLAILLQEFGTVGELQTAIDDNFSGHFDRFSDYSDDAAFEMLASEGIKDDHPVYRYFDFEAFGRDLRMDMNVVEVSDNSVMVFHH